MNMSVFSKYLEPLREANLICLTDDPKPSEIYAALRIAYNQGSVGVEYTTQMISPIANDGDDYDECYDIWECAQSESLKEWIGWVNRKITLQIGLQNYQTIGVRVRIATSMLNMLVQLGKVPDKVAQKIHYYLCNNVRNEITLIVNEELPF
jgi:hypothetical protein